MHIIYFAIVLSEPTLQITIGHSKLKKQSHCILLLGVYSNSMMMGDSDVDGGDYIC